jgi:hypothetical protein
MGIVMTVASAGGHETPSLRRFLAAALPMQAIDAALAQAGRHEVLVRNVFFTHPPLCFRGRRSTLPV